MNSLATNRLLLLATKTGYQTRAFGDAAQQLGLQVVYGTDRCHVLEDPWGDQALPLHFEDPEASSQQIIEFAREHPINAIVALGDRPTPTAARASEALGLPFHPAAAADICRDKYRSREALRAASLHVPAFVRVPIGSKVETGRAPSQQAKKEGKTPHAATLHEVVPVSLPWVLKPLALSGSRGVIRANTPEEARAAFDRIAAMLRSPQVRVLREETSDFIQIEEYVDGIEVAAEALVERGTLKLLAQFDKPDPLTGPYFEETIYVTPSRLSVTAQQKIAGELERAVAALGLHHGPIHAEMRLEPLPDRNSQEHYRVWIMEVAARCIGGLCARALRFSAAEDDRVFGLEELIIRLALGQQVSGVQREQCASGVLMIPIPNEGIYESAEGVDEALGTPCVEEIHITAKEGQRLVPLPEGSSYLGFIFARAETPHQIEHALRAAHSKLRFVLAPALPVV